MYETLGDRQQSVQGGIPVASGTSECFNFPNEPLVPLDMVLPLPPLPPRGPLMTDGPCAYQHIFGTDDPYVCPHVHTIGPPAYQRVHDTRGNHDGNL